jgi:large subunit ribosomal protein L30
MASTSNKIKVTLIKSPIGAKRPHQGCVKGLGLKRLGQTVELTDSPAVRGMVNRVSHLVRVE